MTWFLIVFWYTVLSPFVMFALFAIWARTDNKAFTAIAFVLDVLFNYTSFALLTLDFPRRGEYTFSKRLRRLIFRMDWRGAMAFELRTAINRIKPGHI